MADTHVIHLEPVWRERANFIINGRLKAGLLKQWEQLWVRQIAPYRFEICCIPFFLRDLALGDEVETRSEGEARYVLDRVVNPSGHQTFRVWFGNSRYPQARNELLVMLDRLGCLQEWSSEDLLAVDAATDETASALANYLYEKEQEGYWEYDTGRTR